MLYKVVGIELTSRPFKNDPYESDSHVIDKSYGAIGVVLRPLTASELESRPMTYHGTCSRCGQWTQSTRGGVTCCKWGGCNGDVILTHEYRG